MKSFLKVFIIILIVDVLIGISIIFIHNSISYDGIFIQVINAIISFPTSIWNMFYPQYRIRTSEIGIINTALIAIFNAAIQAIIIFPIHKKIK